MTATAVAQEVVSLRGKAQARYWRCNYCAGGHHGSCPGAVWHRRRVGKDENSPAVPVLWRCECEEPGHPNFPYCTDCKNDRSDEINPDTWRCIDPLVCADRLEKRRQNSELWQMLQRVKSASALKAKANREGQEALLSGMGPDDDAAIERLHDYFDAMETARKKKMKRRVGPPKPRTGACECCGEPTRGGRFLPGHDAKLASSLKTRVESGDDDAYAEMERRGWLGKLPAKLRK